MKGVSRIAFAIGMTQGLLRDADIIGTYQIRVYAQEVIAQLEKASYEIENQQPVLGQQHDLFDMPVNVLAWQLENRT